MNKKPEVREQKPQRYERLQGAEWHNVKGSMRLLYTYESDKGNIKGIYTDGTRKVSHWMDEDEKKNYKEGK